MPTAAPSSLSPKALSLVDALRTWTAGLAPASVAVQEDHSAGYGGLLFKVKPAQPGAMALTVGLGGADDVDFFWGDGCRWEGWKATQREVLEVCEAIKRGEVIEETWTLGPVVIERRCSLGPNGKHGSDGSVSMPRWLKQWARRSTRTFAPWVSEAA
jgi:hypothetical protein